MKPTYREKNLLDYLFGGFRSTLKGLLVLVEKAEFSKEFRSEFHSGGGGHADRRTKFAPGKSLDFSEFSSEFSNLKTLSSTVKVNPVMS